MRKIIKVIKDADSRMKGLLVLMVAYAGIMTTMFTSGATSQIKDYIQTIEIQLQDGNQPTKEYLVKQNEVSSVLDEINVALGPADLLNKDLNYIVNKNDLLQITRVSEEVVEDITVVQSNKIINNNGLNLFGSAVTQQGQNGEVKNTFKVIYQNGKEVSRTLISSVVVKEAMDTVVSTGSVQPGATFTGKLTSYGGDCNGCRGWSSSGVQLSPTTGVNGSNSAKLTYNGQSYYCLAADPSIPFGTIIEITNHKYGIESTAYGIVVDRGGAIKQNKIDIFNGSENGNSYFTGGSSSNVNFKIISVGSGKNFWK